MYIIYIYIYLYIEYVYIYIYILYICLGCNETNQQNPVWALVNWFVDFNQHNRQMEIQRALHRFDYMNQPFDVFLGYSSG